MDAIPNKHDDDHDKNDELTLGQEHVHMEDAPIKHDDDLNGINVLEKHEAIINNNIIAQKNVKTKFCTITLQSSVDNTISKDKQHDLVKQIVETQEELPFHDEDIKFKTINETDIILNESQKDAYIPSQYNGQMNAITDFLPEDNFIIPFTYGDASCNILENADITAQHQRKLYLVNSVPIKHKQLSSQKSVSDISEELSSQKSV